MNRISACIITLNEERNLPRLLESLRGVVDEVVVVDSGSTDRTEAISRQFGAAFHFRSWTNYSEQRNFAASLARHEWALALDADEELSSSLKTALLEWKSRVPQFAVYEIPRRTWYLGAWIEHSGWYPDLKKRLYRNRAAQFAGSLHETLQYEGRCGRLGGDLLHYTIHEFAEHEANVERYSTLAAKQMYEKGKRHWRGAVWFLTPWTLFHSYVLRAGFLDGYRGVLIARMAAKTVRLKYLKLGQLLAERKPSEETK